MSITENFEILVLGSGEAGKYLAWRLANSGKRTAVVERGLIGGSCPNIACLPSKNIIHSAKVASYFRRAKEFGIDDAGSSVDMAGVRQRKRSMVDGLITIHKDRYQASGAELILGNGAFIAPKTIQVTLKDGGTRVLYGDKVFLNTGTRAAIPTINGLKESKPLTHIEALEFSEVPQHLVVLGGGFVGLELAQAFRRFGSAVTILQHGSQLTSSEDADVAEALLKILLDEGIEVFLKAELLQVAGTSGESVHLEVQVDGSIRAIDATHILIAVGRVPNTEEIGLEAAGVELDARGYFLVDEFLRTTAPDVWAMGDCAGSPLFTHVAYDDFRIVHESLMGRPRSTGGRLIPSCMFTDPELAHVGLTELAANEQGVSYRLAKMPMAAVLRARTLSEMQGFMKALVGDDDRILGFTALGVNAGELMAIVQMLMLSNQPFTVLRDAIIAHPTLAEGLMFLFANVPPETAPPRNRTS
jgi:pyruvate/2-oxoglutarate dehydrogenase complex dihydrolipoamide dehydrogenase (E3) component